MSQILTILRAAHCRSTHHYFAIDAIEFLETEKSRRLGNILLKHYDQYLLGAKDPDKKFRDFQNHVLHVGDNNWGGAPRACEKWLKTSAGHLRSGNWEEVAYSLGVLSHYFTDPIMPLHTGSSDKEGAVHRSMEWSVCKAYEDIYDHWQDFGPDVNFELTHSQSWISDAVIAGAQKSHAHYERIIDIYDLKKGARKPIEGLNEESFEILAEMFAIAITGWARILERVADEATSDLPECGLTVSTVVAAIDIPVAWVLKKIDDVGEKRAVQAIFKEYEATGTVRENLPDEVRTVRTEMAIANNHATPFDADDRKYEVRPQAGTMPQRASAKPKVQSGDERVSRSIPESTPSIQRSVSPSAIPVSETRSVAAKSSAHNGPSRDSELVDAPSIGPKTAQRFDKIGIHTIGQFLDADASSLASQLAVRWITDELINDWQCQATLVVNVPSLCGYKSQLLVELDYRSVSDLAVANADELTSQIADYCATKAGSRIIRSASVPELDDVQEWISDAQSSSGRHAA